MTGSLINALCILLAGVAVSLRVRPIPETVQRRLQVFLGVVTMGLGFHVIWQGVGGGWAEAIREVAVIAVSLALGRLTGRWLGAQQGSNRLGQYARDRLVVAGCVARKRPPGEVFTAATVIFCLTPLALVGPMQEGLKDDGRILLVKSAMDALATLAWTRTCGWEVPLAAVPVLSLQGSLSLAFQAQRGWFEQAGMADVTYATGGFMLVAASMVMLQILRVRLVDYLPSLVWAPVLGWLLL